MTKPTLIGSLAAGALLLGCATGRAEPSHLSDAAHAFAGDGARLAHEVAVAVERAARKTEVELRDEASRDAAALGHFARDARDRAKALLDRL